MKIKSLLSSLYKFHKGSPAFRGILGKSVRLEDEGIYRDFAEPSNPPHPPFSKGGDKRLRYALSW
ncbi:MAG: hypothetical protein A2170_15930 [Deltaproteobacteria bacterium RBG_13_53_10]|nr:MAG: hypothetical protein A2170_15930 [Deltaproteobacteria bacterium RBG_13_53_10]